MFGCSVPQIPPPTVPTYQPTTTIPQRLEAIQKYIRDLQYPYGTTGLSGLLMMVVKKYALSGDVSVTELVKYSVVNRKDVITTGYFGHRCSLKEHIVPRHVRNLLCTAIRNIFVY